jgi:hypothetical protein
MKSSHLLRQLALAATITLLAACVATPNKKESLAQSDALIQKQLDAVEAGLQTLPAGQKGTVYLGFAMHSESKAFHGDVMLGLQRFKELNPNTFSIILSNKPETSTLEYPFATIYSMRQVFNKLAMIVPDKNVDIVLLASTHGNKELLSIHIDKYYTGINPIMLRDWFAPLSNKGANRSLLILSACYSGSFIDTLKAPNRTIMTSASATTTSFGCAYEDKNTYFVEALLNDKINPNEPVQNWFDRASKAVLNKEIEKSAGHPSTPQFFNN